MIEGYDFSLSSSLRRCNCLLLLWVSVCVSKRRSCSALVVVVVVGGGGVENKADLKAEGLRNLRSDLVTRTLGSEPKWYLVTIAVGTLGSWGWAYLPAVHDVHVRFPKSGFGIAAAKNESGYMVCAIICVP